MMAALYALEFPAVPFQKAGELLATDGLQTVISSTLSLSDTEMSCMSTRRQPSNASYKFVNSSSNVSPGTATLNRGHVVLANSGG